jgi:hypothetical protein
MDTLAALCDILSATPNDLIEVQAVNVQVAKAAQRGAALDRVAGVVAAAVALLSSRVGVRDEGCAGRCGFR